VVYDAQTILILGNSTVYSHTTVKLIILEWTWSLVMYMWRT